MLKKIIGNSSLYLFGSVLNRGIAFLLLPVYTRYLQPADYGIVAICTSIIYVLLPVLTLNLSAAVNLLYFKLDEKEYKSLLSTVWLWYLIIPLLITCILEILGSFFAHTLFPTIAWHPYLRLAVWIAFLNIAQQLPLAIYYAKQKAAYYAFFSVAFFATNAGFLLYFLIVREAGALGVLQAQAISLLLATIVSYAIVLSQFSSWREITISWKNLKRALHLCVPTIPYTLFVWVITLSDRWILGYFVTNSEIGIYSLAYTIGMIISTIGQSLSSAFSPVYYENYKDPSYRSQLPKLLTFHSIAITMGTLGISLLSPEILRLMASPTYYEAWRLVPIIASAYWAYSTIYILSLMVIENTGKTKWIIVLVVPPALINIGLNWLLVPTFGIWVTAITTLLTYVLMAIIAYFVSRRMDKLPYSWSSFSLIAIIAISTYFFGIFWLTFDNLVMTLFAKGCLLSLTAASMLWINGIRFSQIRSFMKR